jgi:hypothetical protein
MVELRPGSGVNPSLDGYCRAGTIRGELTNRYWKHPNGAAGFELRGSGAGYWIAIQELTPAAQPVLDAVKSQNTAIRAASYLVVDLRGNGGGDDDFGRTLAEQICGRDFVTTVIGPRDSDGGGCPATFRASSDNIAAMSAAATTFQQVGDSVGFTEYTTAVRSMKAAAASGRQLAGSLTCPEKSKSKPAALRSLAGQGSKAPIRSNSRSGQRSTFLGRRCRPYRH